MYVRFMDSEKFSNTIISFIVLDQMDTVSCLALIVTLLTMILSK
jgi:hypothetical protein